MTRRWRSLVGSLRFKVAATVMLILLVAMGLVFGLQYVQLKQEMIERLGVSATPLSGVVKSSLRHAMESRNLSELAAIVENVSRQQNVLRVFVLDKRGEIRFASRPDDVGLRIPRTDATCLICHRREPEVRARTVIYTAAGGERVFRNVTPIANERACFECHGSRDSINGILITDFSTSAIDTELGAKLRQMLLAMFATVGVTGLAITLLMNRLVVDRLERFVEAAGLLGRGKLDLEVPERPRDEIGALASAFNAMVAGLRRARELRERTELLESVLDNVHDGVVVFDPEAIVIALNRSAERLFGVKDTELLGRSGRLLGDEQDAILAGARASGSATHELRLRRPDGVYFPAVIHAVALRGEHGDLLASVVVARDLTEDRVKERLQEQLVQSEKLAAVGRLAAGVAHELNNPLGNVLMYSKLLLETLPESEDDPRAHGEHIVDNTLRCRAIVRALLDYARESEMQYGWAHVHEIVEHSVALMSGHLAGRGIQCEVRLPPDLPRIRCDARQIEQVLVNLLQNGVDAMDGAGGVITVFAEAVRERDALVFGVRDTGPGVPPDSASRIFDPFYTTKADGTGLGLSICAGIVARHHGRLWVESGSGAASGATFFIELPMAA